MILYMDSSSLVTLYVEEDSSAAAEQLVERADRIATSRIAYAEVRAALAGARRAQRVDQGLYDELLGAFNRDWRGHIKVSPSERLIQVAGDLAEKHALRGYDAVHLASAVSLAGMTPEPVSFSAGDLRLQQAASGEGLTIA